MTHFGVLFDLDGTLLDTLEDLATSGNEVLAARGCPTHSKEAYKTFIGNGMTNLICTIFPEADRPETEEEIAEALAEYRAAYGRNWTNTTCAFPGIRELLTELEKTGIPIGVVSNKSHDFTVKCVEEFLPDWEWSAVLGHREGAEKKPHPQGALEAAEKLGLPPERCLFVGDSDVDMMTAVNAGMQAVGVEWGFRSTEELQQAGATEILATPGDLLNLLR